MKHLLFNTSLLGDSTRPVTSVHNLQAQQISISVPNACASPVAANNAVPITFPNQNVTANQLVQAVYMNQFYGKVPMSCMIQLEIPYCLQI